MPVIIAPIAVATMWRWMYDPFFGLFNAALTGLGLDGLIQDWLGDRNVALYSMFVASVWQTVGFSLVLFLAGLQSVSPTLIEASRVDGASRFQIFRYVTLPALRPSITIVLHPVDHKFLEGVRHCVRHDARGPGAIDPDAGALGFHAGHATRRFWSRRRHFRRAAGGHDRHRRPLSRWMRGHRELAA